MTYKEAQQELKEGNPLYFYPFDTDTPRYIVKEIKEYPKEKQLVMVYVHNSTSEFYLMGKQELFRFSQAR